MTPDHSASRSGGAHDPVVIPRRKRMAKRGAGPADPAIMRVAMLNAVLSEQEGRRVIAHAHGFFSGYCAAFARARLCGPILAV